jgi:hypothetical protein
VRFWDSSALVPLILDEPTTEAARDLISSDAEVAVWIMTSVELLSAVARLVRAADGLEDLAPALRSDVLQLTSRVSTVADVDAVRRRAERLVSMHPLSAAEAMQLAAALVGCGDRPELLPFVTLDRPLARSAQLEGFQVLMPG